MSVKKAKVLLPQPSKTKDTSYMQKMQFKKNIKKWIIFIILAVGSLTMLSPLWWMVSTALKPMDEIMSGAPTFIPETIKWSNFVEAWQSAPFTRYLFNSLFVTSITVIANVLSNAFVAYGFAKIKFRGRNVLFAILLATMMIPGFVMMIPQYILFAKIGWVNTYLPLIVPHVFGSAFFIFLLRQFFMTIPNELIEAAKMDGANHFYIWSRLMLPLIKPALATVAIFAFNASWNDLINPLLYLSDESKYTLQLGLATFQGRVHTQWNYLMSASVLVMLPVLIIFFIFQKYFIQGMNLTGGSKG
ncbi:carbohydrate ABC transporter permease [Sediminibacillus massiliensis]|uniref:carbohydrate ABC transporter permease n=1 Tax=Sediminibacillus massiliensis TaxID=1926277 RepID=UPI0024820029|nr:carbohydrate ABC transporter permease [Sediminibacillus massiliensis]